jgi:hypothetical protein
VDKDTISHDHELNWALHCQRCRFGATTSYRPLVVQHGDSPGGFGHSLGCLEPEFVGMESFLGLGWDEGGLRCHDFSWLWHCPRKTVAASEDSEDSEDRGAV